MPATNPTAAALARLLSTDAGYTYGNVLPLAKNNTTGALSPAMPGMVRSGLQGLADAVTKGIPDLVNMRTAPSAQPGVNTLTPDSLGALMGMPAAGVAPAGAVASGAVRRAALPMDEASRMARAAEYHTDLYHGTGADISAFTRGRRGLWATDDPNIANIYAKFSDPAVGRDVRAQAATDGPNVMPLKLRGKVLTISDQKPGTSGGNGGWSTDNLARALGMDPDKLPPGTRYRDLMNEAKDRGYSAVKIEGMSDLGGDMQTQWSILDPSSVRSRFAAFDPAKKDSTDLLASRSPGYPLAGQQPQDQRRVELARALSKVQK